LSILRKAHKRYARSLESKSGVQAKTHRELDAAIPGVILVGEKMNCPSCKKPTKNLPEHFRKSETCKQKYIDDVKNMLESFSRAKGGEK